MPRPFIYKNSTITYDINRITPRLLKRGVYRVIIKDISSDWEETRMAFHNFFRVTLQKLEEFSPKRVEYYIPYFSEVERLLYGVKRVKRGNKYFLYTSINMDYIEPSETKQVENLLSTIKHLYEHKVYNEDEHKVYFIDSRKANIILNNMLIQRPVIYTKFEETFGKEFAKHEFFIKDKKLFFYFDIVNKKTIYGVATIKRYKITKFKINFGNVLSQHVNHETVDIFYKLLHYALYTQGYPIILLKGSKMLNHFKNRKIFRSLLFLDDGIFYSVHRKSEGMVMPLFDKELFLQYVNKQNTKFIYIKKDKININYNVRKIDRMLDHYYIINIKSIKIKSRLEKIIKHLMNMFFKQIIIYLRHKGIIEFNFSYIINKMGDDIKMFNIYKIQQKIFTIIGLSPKIEIETKDGKIFGRIYNDKTKSYEKVDVIKINTNYIGDNKLQNALKKVVLVDRYSTSGEKGKKYIENHYIYLMNHEIANIILNNAYIQESMSLENLHDITGFLDAVTYLWKMENYEIRTIAQRLTNVYIDIAYRGKMGKSRAIGLMNIVPRKKPFKYWYANVVHNFDDKLFYLFYQRITKILNYKDENIGYVLVYDQRRFINYKAITLYDEKNTINPIKITDNYFCTLQPVAKVYLHLDFEENVKQIIERFRKIINTQKMSSSAYMENILSYMSVNKLFLVAVEFDDMEYIKKHVEEVDDIYKKCALVIANKKNKEKIKIFLVSVLSG
jgi:hypothetical protein